MDLNDGNEEITCWYWRRSNGHYNAGDDYNKYLMEKLYGCRVQLTPNNPDLCVCGSILANKNISNCKYVLGSGI